MLGGFTWICILYLETVDAWCYGKNCVFTIFVKFVFYNNLNITHEFCG